MGMTSERLAELKRENEEDGLLAAYEAQAQELAEALAKELAQAKRDRDNYIKESEADIAELEAALARAREALAIGAEIMGIMETYRAQEAEGCVDTPGGLEHMGDVWKLLEQWDERLRG